MGLFDKVLKSVMDGTADSLIKNAKDALEQATGQDIFKDDGYNQEYPAQAVPRQASYDPSHSYDEPLKDHAWFKDLLTQDFPGITVHENVPVASMFPGKDGRDYSFVLSKDGRALGAIMLTRHNKYNNAAFKGAKAACEEAGLPFINFFLHMSNTHSYVSSRIKATLGL